MQTIVIDLETSGLDKNKDKILLVGYKINEDEVKFCDDVGFCSNNYGISKISDELKSEEVIKIGHNILFDLGFLKAYGCEINGPIFDTMIAYHQKYPFKNCGLKYILRNELNQDVVELMELCHKEVDIYDVKGRFKKKKKVKISVEEFYNLFPDKLKEYCKKDVEGSYSLFRLLKNDITDWCKNIEFNLIECMEALQNNGIMLDKYKLKGLENYLTSNINRIRGNYSINLNSPNQVRQLLIDNGKENKLREFRTDKRQISVGKLALKSVGEKDILSYRESCKLLNTYIRPMLTKDIIKGNFNQSGTITGRISSSKPNMQNIPNRTETGKRIRECFIPREGYKFIIADYSQIEPRLLAHYSKDKELLNIFNNKKDLHEYVAKEITGKSEVNKDERFIGKTIGLAIMYGASVNRLLDVVNNSEINIDCTRIASIRSQVINKFNSLFIWTMRFNERARIEGFIKTIGGRIVTFPEYEYVNYVNHLIQASASDIMKLSLLNLYNHGFKILSTIHDEVIIEEKESTNKVDIVKNIMENSFRLQNVPLVVDAKICNSWADK